MYPYSYPGLLGKGLSFTKAINWSALLDGTQKTLGVINQAIPIVYQVKPIIGNAKTLFKIANAINTPSSNEITTVENTINQNVNTTQSISQSNNSPIFYI